MSADESETDLYAALHKALHTANYLYELQKFSIPAMESQSQQVFIPYADMSMLDIQFRSNPCHPAFQYDQQGEQY